MQPSQPAYHSLEMDTSCSTSFIACGTLYLPPTSVPSFRPSLPQPGNYCCTPPKCFSAVCLTNASYPDCRFLSFSSLHVCTFQTCAEKARQVHDRASPHDDWMSIHGDYDDWMSIHWLDYAPLRPAPLRQPPNSPVW